MTTPFASVQNLSSGILREMISVIEDQGYRGLDRLELRGSDAFHSCLLDIEREVERRIPEREMKERGGTNSCDGHESWSHGFSMWHSLLDLTLRFSFQGSRES